MLLKKRKIFQEKKGDVTDIMTVGFWLLILGIGIFAVMFIIFQIVPSLKSTVIGDNADASSALDSLNTYGSLAVPGTFLIVFFALILGVLISSFFVRTHPIFIPVYILFALVSIIVAVVVGNVWGNLKDVSEFSSVISTNTITQLMDVIISNIVLVTLVFFIITLVVIFAKPGSGQTGLGGSTPA